MVKNYNTMEGIVKITLNEKEKSTVIDMLKNAGYTEKDLDKALSLLEKDFTDLLVGEVEYILFEENLNT